MEFIPILKFIWLSLFSMQGYLVQDQILVSDTDGVRVSDKQCRDRGVVQFVEAQKESYYLASICDNKPRLFALSDAESFDSMSKPPQLEWYTLENKDWFLYLGEAEPSLLFLGNKKDFVINEFLWQPRSFVMNINQTLYIAEKQHDFAVQMTKLAKFPPGANIKLQPNTMDYWLLKDADLLLLRNGEISNELAVYDFKQNEWLLLPPVEFDEEEQKAMGNANILLRLELPPDTRRFYYKIFVNSEQLGRTRFATQGEKVLHSLQLKPGRHVIRLEKYSAEELSGNVEYEREKNIHQLEPISIDIDNNAKYLLYIRPGTSDESKPFVLESIRVGR
ncbi:MAG: hypothetical protein KDK38_06180 [Leptospiraceae bacterium]|nr:hypothetical protein [Leptospiraceae bacterium]